MINHNAETLHEALGVSTNEVDRIADELSNNPVPLTPSMAIEKAMDLTEDLMTLLYAVYMIGFNHAAAKFSRGDL